MPDPTFGCGTVLAGFGGGNLSEGGAGDRVWGGNDDDDDPPFVDVGDRDPIPPGDGGGGGPQVYRAWVCTGPPLWKCNAVVKRVGDPPPQGSFRTKAECQVECHGGGGPGTPGPGGPAAPPPGTGPRTGGGSDGCKCRMTGQGVTTTSPGSPTGTFYKSCWKQKCEPEDKKPTSHRQIEAETLKLYSRGMRNIKVTGTAGNGCKTKGSCKKGNDKCSDICISWYDPEIVIEGPTTPGSMGDYSDGLTNFDGNGGGFTSFDQTGDRNSGGGLTSSDGNGNGNGGGFSTADRVDDKGIRGGLGEVDGAGGGLVSASRTNKGDLMQSIRDSGEADLDNPEIQGYFRTKRPTGIIDSDIAITGNKLSPGDMVTNDVGYTNILGPMIHRGIQYVLKNNKNWKDWDSNAVYNVTTNNVINSLDLEFLQMMRSIKHPGGANFSNQDIFKIVGTRIIEGSLGSVDVNYLKEEARKSEKRDIINIKKGTNPLINEMAALSILEKNFIPLEPSASTGRNGQIMQNWKVLSTDIGKYLPIMLDGEERRYYIRDDDRVAGRTSLQVKDGDYINISVGGQPHRLYCKSQRNHAFITQGDSRQKALQLLGSDGKTTLGVSLDSSTNVDFDYSLSTPRENLYILSGNFSPSALKTVPVVGSNKSNLLKNTSATYELVPIETTQELRNFNDFILYKANYKSFMVDTQDQFIDYMVSAGSITLEQDDILFDTAKTSPSTPLLTRRIPWYIIIYPTNKFENTLFNSKSKITSYDTSGKTIRKLKFSPTINSSLSNPKAEKFIKVKYGFPNYPNVYGEINTVSRVTELIPNKGMYKVGCRLKGKDGSIKTLNPHRRKTGFRLIYEIIKELNTNYFLDNQGLGKSLNNFDVFSRLNMSEFNKFIATENATRLLPVIRNGLIEGVEVCSPIRNAGRNAMRKTRLLQKKANAPVDKYKSIKAMDTGFIIEPPGTSFNSSKFVPSAPHAGPITR